MTTIDNIMALANAYAESYRDALAPNVNALVDEAQTALRTAVTEAYKEAFARGMAVRPASAALAKDASLICEGTKAQPIEPTHYLDAMGLCYTAERAKFIGIDVASMVALYAAPRVAQPVREPLQDSLAWELWLNAVDTANNTGRLVAYTYKEAIERAHNIRGEN